MEIVLILALTILLAIACQKMSKFFYRVSADLKEKEEQERFHKEALIAAIQDLKEKPVEEEVLHPAERLLRANQELIEKRQVQDAMEKELGIEMH